MAQTLCLTGGPSGGKTTLAMAICRAFGDKVAMVPESASLLFSGGFRRVSHQQGVRHQQRAIYHVQVEHEQIFSIDFSDRLLICDRGTLDGLAYWPGDETEFFSNLDTNRDLELKRYNWVIHLDTADSNGYNGRANPHRIEDLAQATHINQRVREAWRGHPARFIIPATDTFLVKMSIALNVVEQILRGCDYGQVCSGVKGLG